MTGSTLLSAMVSYLAIQTADPTASDPAGRVKNALARVVTTPVVTGHNVAGLATQIRLLSASHGGKEIWLLDLAPTAELADMVEALAATGMQVIYEDHHMPSQTDQSEQATATRAAYARIEKVAASAARSTRTEFPSCADLVSRLAPYTDVPESAVVVTHNDLDGLLSAGIVLNVLPADPWIIKDANVLDGSRAARTAENLSPLGLACDRAICSLPAFNPKSPEVRETAWGDYCYLVLLAYNGHVGALLDLEGMAGAWEALETASIAVANGAVLDQPGLVVLDVRGADRYDTGTVQRLLDEKHGLTAVVATIKSSGPIAGIHGGVQVSLCSNPTKGGPDLKALATRMFGTFQSSPESGIISNIPALLHLSQDRWEEFRTRWVVTAPEPNARVTDNS